MASPNTAFYAEITGPSEVVDIDGFMKITVAGQTILLLSPVVAYPIIQKTASYLHAAVLLEGMMQTSAGVSFRFLAVHCVPGGDSAMIRVEGDNDKQKLCDNLARYGGSAGCTLYQGDPTNVDSVKTPLSGFRELVIECMTAATDAPGLPRPGAAQNALAGTSDWKKCWRFMYLLLTKFEIPPPQQFLQDVYGTPEMKGY